MPAYCNHLFVALMGAVMTDSLGQISHALYEVEERRWMCS
jgi:hypothetical protein